MEIAANPGKAIITIVTGPLLDNFPTKNTLPILDSFESLKDLEINTDEGITVAIAGVVTFVTEFQMRIEEYGLIQLILPFFSATRKF